MAAACELAGRALETDPQDVPFALIYLLDSSGHLSRAALAGLDTDHPDAATAGADASVPWPFADALRTRSMGRDRISSTGPSIRVSGVRRDEPHSQPRQRAELTESGPLLAFHPLSQLPQARRNGGKAMAKRSSGSKRELITGRSKQYARRDASGRFKEVEGVGRSLTQDRKRDARSKSTRGQGDRGDR